jgi:toxin ParE1/3/4
MQVILKLTDLAEQDLVTIENYIAQENKKAARRTIEKIFKSLDFLRSFPDMGRLILNGQARQLVINDTPYVAVYRMKKMTIEVVRVIHTSRQWIEIVEKEPALHE